VSRPYDILVGDAFSSDAIPAHLLTREAFQLYARRLKPDGVLALNVSTRHLDLGPLIKGLAASIGKSAVEIETATDDEGDPLNARWILITSDTSIFETARIKRSRRIRARGARRRVSGPTTTATFQVLKK
jgi:hypothetical protein